MLTLKVSFHCHFQLFRMSLYPIFVVKNIHICLVFNNQTDKQTGVVNLKPAMEKPYNVQKNIDKCMRKMKIENQKKL